MKLKKALKIGDGIAIWKDDKVIGFTVSKIKIIAKSKDDNVGEAINSGGSILYQGTFLGLVRGQIKKQDDLFGGVFDES